MRRAKSNDSDNDNNTAELLDELQNIKDEEQLNRVWHKLAANPFLGDILERITLLEQKALEYDRHEHKTNGDIVLRTK